jgi:hypothetical protein
MYTFFYSILYLLTGTFSLLRKQVAVEPVFEKGNSTLVTDYRRFLVLNNFSEVFESIIHDCSPFSLLKYKLQPSQYSFIK